jgi:hypothetical protein
LYYVKWKCSFVQTFHDEADIFILGWGQLNNWAFPDIPGLHSFKGEYMHSADFKENFDPTGKTVAIVGGGSTGVQILPQIQPKAKKVQQYMRSQYVFSPFSFVFGHVLTCFAGIGLPRLALVHKSWRKGALWRPETVSAYLTLSSFPA